MEIRRGVIRSFNSSTYQATVQLAGAGPVFVEGVPVSKEIDSTWLVVGAKVAVLFFDRLSQGDAVVFAVYN